MGIELATSFGVSDSMCKDMQNLLESMFGSEYVQMLEFHVHKLALNI